MKLYHITKSKNIVSILNIGILPKYGKGLTRKGCDKVFLTNDIDRIIKTQGGVTWESGIAIIEVDVKDYETHIYKCYVQPKYSDFEFTIDKVEVNEIINIKIIRSEK